MIIYRLLVLALFTVLAALTGGGAYVFYVEGNTVLAPILALQSLSAIGMMLVVFEKLLDD